MALRALEQADKVIVNARELLTLKGRGEGPRQGPEMKDLGLIEDGAVAIKGDTIISVGTTPEVFSAVEIRKGETEIIDAKDQVVLPGLIDPHTHLLYGGSRPHELEERLKGTPYMQILKEGGGILNTVSATRKTSSEDLFRITRKRLLCFLQHGVTTLEIKSGYGLTPSEEIRSLEIIQRLGRGPLTVVPTFLGAHAIPLEFKDDPDRYVDLVVEEMLPQVAEKDLARFCDVFCEEGVFSVEQSRRILSQAKELGLLLKIHADEMTPCGGAELSAELSATSAEHLLKITPAGMEKMAQKKVMAVLLPGTAFYLEKAYAPAREMIEAGIPVAMSSDFNPGSSPIESPWIIMGLAVLKMGMTTEEAICAFTINAARALALDQSRGSLEVGKQADIIMLDMETYREIPYYFGASRVELVLKDGRRIL